MEAVEGTLDSSESVVDDEDAVTVSIEVQQYLEALSVALRQHSHSSVSSHSVDGVAVVVEVHVVVDSPAFAVVANAAVVAAEFAPLLIHFVAHA